MSVNPVRAGGEAQGKSVAIQMDPLESITLKNDTTILLAREAEKRGYRLWYYTPGRLSWHEGKVIARAQRLVFKEHSYALGESIPLDLSTMDVVLLRQDPPFDMAYITTTYLLEKLPSEVLVVNPPPAVRDLPEKLFPTLFKEFMPPTLISADAESILEFRARHKDIVMKPLYEFSGRSVFHIAPEDKNFESFLEARLAKDEPPWIAQRFLPDIRNGDRRVYLIDGDIAGVMGRMPPAQDFRANLHAGGTAIKAELTARQRQICEALKPMLKEKKVIFAGIDLIGDCLIEINITSPGIVCEFNALYNTRLETKIWDAIENRLT